MFYLKRNLPTRERAARVLGSLAVAGGAAWALPAGAVLYAVLASAAGFALTGVVGYCPACAAIGRRPTEAGR